MQAGDHVGRRSRGRHPEGHASRRPRRPGAEAYGRTKHVVRSHCWPRQPGAPPARARCIVGWQWAPCRRPGTRTRTPTRHTGALGSTQYGPAFGGQAPRGTGRGTPAAAGAGGRGPETCQPFAVLSPGALGAYDPQMLHKKQGPTRTHTHMRTHAHAHTPPRLGRTRRNVQDGFSRGANTSQLLNRVGLSVTAGTDPGWALHRGWVRGRPCLPPPQSRSRGPSGKGGYGCGCPGLAAARPCMAGS